MSSEDARVREHQLPKIASLRYVANLNSTIRHPSQKEGILACDRTLQIASRRHQPPIVSIVCLAKACKDSSASPGISSESFLPSPSKRPCNNDIWLTVSKEKEHHIDYFPSRNGVQCWVLLYQAGGPRQYMMVQLNRLWQREKNMKPRRLIPLVLLEYYFPISYILCLCVVM